MKRLLLVGLALSATSCVDVMWTRYDPTRVFPPVVPDSVVVFWTPPPFDVELIGEMRIEPCGVCDDNDIAHAVSSQAGPLGADVVVVVNENSRFAGAVVSANQWSGQQFVNVDVRSKRRLLAVMGRRRQSQQPVTTSVQPLAPPPPLTGRATLLNIGMSQDRVQEVLGPPDWQSSFEVTTRWEYSDMTLVFENRVLRTIFQK